MTQRLQFNPPAPADAHSSQLPADIPLRRGSDASFGSGGLGVFRAFSLVLLLLLLCAWFLRRWRMGNRPALSKEKGSVLGRWSAWVGGASGSSQLQVLESRHLTPKASLHVVRWRGKEWLVGCHERGIQVIDQHLPDPLHEAGSQKEPA